MGHNQLTVARLCKDRSDIDIVATQGAYLFSPAHTPVWEKDYDEEFAATLSRKLRALNIRQLVRRVMYHEAAEEWPIGHTPPEVKERRAAELRALEEAEGPTSDEDSASDGDSDATVNDKSGAENGQAALVQTTQPQPLEAGLLLTPPLSAYSPIPTPHRKKRRKISTRDEKEEDPRKTHVTSAAGVDFSEVISKESQEKSRKRRWTDGVSDKGEDREYPVKARKIAAPASKWRQRHQSIPLGAG